MQTPLRVAFFPDAFNEVDGVAMVARRFEEFAAARLLPFLLVHAGPKNETIKAASVKRIQLKRSPASFPLDRAHEFDLAFSRHFQSIASALRSFCPDVIQITGPSDVGILGATLAHRLGIPLAGFWLTNLPQYAGLRMTRSVAFLPAKLASNAAKGAERASAALTEHFYRWPRLLFAPNQEIVTSLAKATGRPCLLLPHGVDSEVFNPAHRPPGDGRFTIGYVGRLSSEKNVRALATLEEALVSRGHRNFRILIVGQGTEAAWLAQHMRHAEITGVLRGDALSRAYAGMDVFAFPSETDTFGLAVLEALASGVPAVVTSIGGPKDTVRHGVTGFVADSFGVFAESIELLMNDSQRLAAMRKAARNEALRQTWESAFEGVYRGYDRHLNPSTTSAHNSLDAADAAEA